MKIQNIIAPIKLSSDVSDFGTVSLCSIFCIVEEEIERKRETIFRVYKEDEKL